MLQEVFNNDITLPIGIGDMKIYGVFEGLVLKMDSKMKQSLNTKANYLVWDNEKFLGQFFTSKEVSAQLSKK